MLRNILARLAAMGTDYIQLNKFATHQRAHSAGLVLQAFLGALQNYLQCYRAAVLSVEGLCIYLMSCTSSFLFHSSFFSKFGLPIIFEFAKN